MEINLVNLILFVQQDFHQKQRSRVFCTGGVTCPQWRLQLSVYIVSICCSVSSQNNSHH